MSSESLTNQKSQKRQHSSIISPLVDFFMVGGMSLLIIPLVMLPFWDSAENKELLYLGSFYLIFVLNMPHFVHSYQLLYKGYLGKIFGPAYGGAAKLRFWISGVIAPLLMIAYFIYGARQPTSAALGYGVNAMLFFVGWHYVKQGYGVMITLGVRKKAFFDDLEKKVLLVNAYVAWIFAWGQVNSVLEQDMFQEIPFQTIGISKDVMHWSQIGFVCWSVGVLLFLIRRFDGGRVISINGMVAYLSAVYLWVAFANTHPHIIIFVPALHSAQYLLFVWKMVYERTKEEALGQTGGGDVKLRSSDVFTKMLPFLGIGFGAGLVFFSWLPSMLDKTISYDTSIFGPNLFIFMFLIFLNIHHYFIDFSIWRKENPDMRHLFK